MIKGYVKTSLVDYPARIATTIFIGNCNFRCPYCHNPTLVLNQDADINQEEIISYLIKRKDIVEAVCVTGGEPTLWPELASFLRKIKDMGLLVKIDTNGTNPNMLKFLIVMHLIDYIAMDIKAPLEKYKDVVKANVNTDAIRESIELIKASGIDYEFRTTVHSALLSFEDIIQIARELSLAKRLALQEFRGNRPILDNSYAATNSFGIKDLELMKKEILRLKLIDDVHIR
jgi:pyruvate formate lyase activating enzyme